ncbi:MAG TPA: hypothetical protein VL295_03800 [Gemmatimonadales bacterium]|nr:hypothetical protein [Gemmatimonadales bacterium]
MALRSMVKGVWRSCALLALSATALGAQSAPRYTAEELRCIRFRVTVTTDVKTELQGRERLERVVREGVLTVRGTAVDSGVAIEAWWDSLRLSRTAEGKTLTPDADGILGGFYRGFLTPAGHFTRTGAPWVPDEVAEVSDLTMALDDLFPRFDDGTVVRISDAGGMRRWRVTQSRELDAPADSTRPFAVLESESSEGIAGWDRYGFRSWVRTVRSETRVKETPRRTFRTQVTQQITLQRLDWCGSGAAAGRAGE